MLFSIFKSLCWVPLQFYFDICQWFLIRMIQQAYKYVRLSLWPFKILLEHKIMKSDWAHRKRVSSHGNQFFYSSKCIACGTITLPSFNGLCLKLTKIGLFIYSMLRWFEWMTSSILSIANVYTLFKLKIYLQNQCGYSISKLLTAFLIFPGTLCDKPKESDHSSILSN